MKLIILIGFLFASSFHQVGIGEEGTIEAKVIKSNDKNLINISAENISCIDSLIIHTDKWKIALASIDISNDCLFELNSAETAVLSVDLVKSFELRINGESRFYQSTDSDFLRQELSK